MIYSQGGCAYLRHDGGEWLGQRHRSRSVLEALFQHHDAVGYAFASRAKRQQEVREHIRGIIGGKMVSVANVIQVTCFTDDNGHLMSSARQNSTLFFELPCSEHDEVCTL